MPRPRNDDIHFEADVPEGLFEAHRAIHVSNDGSRVTTGLVGIRPQKRVRTVEELGDDYGQWVPVNDDGAEDLEAVADTVTSYDVTLEEDDPVAKRKRYKSSDEPMSLFRPLAPDFLDALLRREGLGDYVHNPACTCCGVSYGDGVRLFRCTQCGEFLQCYNCVLSRHALTPLHCLREWNGEHWVEARLSGGETELGRSLGLVYQLGHHGLPCDFPGPERQMVVIDITGIHTLTFRYCTCDRNRRTANGTLGQIFSNGWYPATTIDPETCATIDVLEQFRLFNVVGNVNVQDFVGALERKVDPLQMSSVPDRYKAFGRITRQYGYLLRAKRLGCAHKKDGLVNAKPGELAVLCWPCPHDGKNLPEGWRDVAPEWRFLYALLLALDANFRLKNRLRSNEHQDPSLASGLGYFVEEQGYKEHLKNYVAEKDVSTCIAFAALLQKETRMTTGLRCSGVGGCVCARHGVVRPQGIGDLQKGERYANMDYIFLSALMGVSVLALAVSYDIACQWKVNLATRAKKMGEEKTKREDKKIKDGEMSESARPQPLARLEDFEIQFALPVWHAAAHETSCQSQNSLSYTEGVGRTDGEGIERTWAVLNPLGFSTKEMGYGARQDALENKIDHLNFEKNIKQGDTLARKIIVAIAERDKQVANFHEVDRTIATRIRRKWQSRIDEWLADKQNKPNPYCLEGGRRAGPSEAEVLRELKAAEALEAAEGREAMSQSTSTPAAFIKAGLQLEESQRRIKAEVKGVTLVTADRASQIQEMRNTFLKKLRTFVRLQANFMPGVEALKEAAEEARDADTPPPKAEHIKLWMPSELDAEKRRRACRKGVAEAEARLRRGQCADALDVVRSRLHAQTHLITWRNANSVGQGASTRSATLIGRVGDRIARVAAKYRAARAAMVALKGPQYAAEFKPLEQSDLNTHLEEESDTASRRKLSRLGSSKRARNEPSSKKKVFSWIWTVNGGPGEDDTQLHESVRVEWSKAKARRDRWVEEVRLLREEMKRVLRMLRFIQGEWHARIDARTNVDPELQAGLAAYAKRQVYVHHRIADTFHTGWSGSIAAAVKQVMERDGTAYQELLTGPGVDWAPALGLDGVEEGIAASA
ncbi:hypothetical protein C8R47DRAFT_1208549 [Mycena vitilis]|nr:hypothetical protein C8R47DRAFT_1208549 [Mycena vitilis]